MKQNEMQSMLILWEPDGDGGVSYQLRSDVTEDDAENVATMLDHIATDIRRSARAERIARLGDEYAWPEHARGERGTVVPFRKRAKKGGA
jgi:hypothetical protein